MIETYHLKVAGLERDLPICPVNDKLDIAGFIMFGDVELTIACAEELLKKVPDFDVILTAEAKSIPLVYEMSRQSGKKYYPARKKVKAYMLDPVVITTRTITTAGDQTLCIDQSELDEMAGKRILIVDDVISTGGALKALEEIAAHTTGTVVGKAAVLAEGDAGDRTDIIYLEKLPLFFK